MADRGIDQEEEKKSYGSVFLLAASLLVVVSLWSIWDDNITRHSWKRFQSQFYTLDYAKARAAYEEEDKKLQGDPAYQELAKKLADEKARLDRGDLAKRLRDLRRQEVTADIRFVERDQAIKFVKSELEEAWYEYDHAVQTGRDLKPYLATIERLNKQQAKLEPGFEEARKNREAIKEEIRKLHSGIRDLETELTKLSADRDRWLRVIENATVGLGPVSVYKVPNIRQVVLPEFDRNRFDEPLARVDRCQTCHMAINRPGFEDEPHPFKTHPRREVLLADNAHPPERFGCTACHDGQGTAVNRVEQAHGEVQYWERPLLRGAKAQASCASCHLNAQGLEDAPLLAEGQRLFEQIGCTGCHLVQGYEDIPKVGPSLRKITAKLDPSWMVRWIQNPQAYLPRTRMPNFDFKEDEAIAISAYLWSASKEEGAKWTEQHPPPAGVRNDDKALAAQGKQLAESIGCKGCHGFAEGEFSTVLGKEKEIVPNLKNIAAKVDSRWVYHWVKNPRDFSPEAKMPSLRLTDREAAAITAYLATLGGKGEPIPGIEEKLQDPKNIKQGETLVRKYGCAGCHDIPGMEKESRIGVELTTFGSKVLEELFFGNRTDIRHTWDDWTYHKLKEPRIYETPRVEQLMPQFHLADEDIKALSVVLAGFREGRVPSRYRADESQRVINVVQGRRLMHQYNCLGCHEIENRGGFVRKYYADNPTLAPPPLNGQGEKVQSSWFFSFLKQPTPVRPWLEIRMPTFQLSDAETNSLVSYFNGLSRVEVPFTHFDPRSVPREHLDAARALFSRDYFDCLSCHQQGDKKPEGPQDGWAPDLNLAYRRLAPSWIIKWLQDPQQVQPGTRMPSFFPGGPDDILGGKDDRQIEAMRDYIMTLGAGQNAGPDQAARRIR